MTTILTVDDSHLNIELLRNIFEPFGYEIIAAQNIQEALSLAREIPPDLILSDIHMPNGDGFDFIRTVKADPKISSIPFVFISSSVWPDKDQITALALGAQKFIARPIETQILLKEVEECLRK